MRERPLPKLRRPDMPANLQIALAVISERRFLDVTAPRDQNAMFGLVFPKRSRLAESGNRRAFPSSAGRQGFQ